MRANPGFVRPGRVIFGPTPRRLFLGVEAQVPSQTSWTASVSYVHSLLVSHCYSALEFISQRNRIVKLKTASCCRSEGSLPQPHARCMKWQVSCKMKNWTHFQRACVWNTGSERTQSSGRGQCHFSLHYGDWKRNTAGKEDQLGTVPLERISRTECSATE